MRNEFKVFFDSKSVSINDGIQILQYLEKVISQLHVNYANSNDWIWSDDITPKNNVKLYALRVRKYFADIFNLYKENGFINETIIGRLCDNYNIEKNIFEPKLSELYKEIELNNIEFENWEKEERELDRIRRVSGPYCSSCESAPCQCSDPERISCLY
jgi:hypothetical protein